ncbi:MAG: SpoIIE family protein phosphatase [Flavobacteriales bacterium]|nr:SpoIIE family protein phosphatase [Flavobacteriales bacterium]MCW8912847.1 SpoIIE family protein phosphatase [Flavobacteriales bacterium]MCW8937196.1 SpoIIE family protein phosphatase [Flavobacteriales bacterium]MCW8968632.1 SpoIIE family protein phosphatase [Flavobacteriales bacterium]MCW8989874.1 SpoIIE family protein phosphatase [Flavobacteriales bacterium]
MKSILIKISFLFILFQFGNVLLAQDNHSHVHGHEENQSNKVEYLSFKDTFLGSEDNFQVCYPKDHRNFFYMIFLLILLVAILAIFTFINVRKNNKLLGIQNKIIEEKNKDLVDSIKYSLQIQKSILPKNETVKNAFENIFIFYSPKDIVSGDFYWVFSDERYAYVAVVDCTGHGVPGAFLSLIGNNAINKAVKEDGETDPGIILDKMNFYVKETLNQHGDGELKDGMEVSLCKLDKVENTLYFAGANLSLVYFNEGELNIVKGSKCTVGSVQPHVKGVPPVTNKIHLKKGDSFYLYTDGIIDQFGGEYSKKFKISGLKSLLSSVYQKDIVTQEAEVVQVFETWKKNQEQLDDVCLIGVSV